MPVPDELLTPQEVAILLRVSNQAVYNWLTSDPPKLTGYKAGDNWRIKRSDVDAFLKCNRSPENG